MTDHPSPPLDSPSPGDRTWVPRRVSQSPPWLAGWLVALYGPPLVLLVAHTAAPDGPVLGPLWQFRHFTQLWAVAATWVVVSVAVGAIVSAWVIPRRVGVSREHAFIERRGAPWQLGWTEFYRPVISLGRFGAIVHLRGETPKGATLLLSRDQAWEVARLGGYSGWSPGPERGVPAWLEGRFRALRSGRGESG